MTFPVTRCPFIKCKSTVNLIIEQATPGDDESTVQRVQIHDLQPDTWFGRCPASLTIYPTSVDNLKEFSRDIYRHKNMKDDHDRQDREAASVPCMGEVNGPGAPPADARWFKSRTGDNPRVEQGVKGFKRLLLGVYAEPQRIHPGASRGGAVASVAEVKAAIQQATERLAEAQEAIRVAGGIMAEGAALLQWVAQTAAVDSLGVQLVNRAQEDADAAQRLLAGAIDEARAYGGSM
jgi:hypothetical protein